MTTQDKTHLPHVLMTGNPVDGVDLHGPFDSFSAALDWAERNKVGPDWWLVPVNPVWEMVTE